MFRFTVTTRLNDKPMRVWRSKRKTDFDIGKVNVYTDRLGHYYTAEVIALNSVDAKWQAEELIKDFLKVRYL